MDMDFFLEHTEVHWKNFCSLRRGLDHSLQVKILVENNSMRACNFLKIHKACAQGMYLKESQNLRTDEAGRDLWRSPTPLPLAKEGSITVCFSRVMQEHNSISLFINDQLSKFMFLLH